ncbi:RNA polymerase sigma factor [Streptomyces boninensis]|uniref:RNA polymerase sigma factor n=1 Tax=Streptomyces boninensis TaxID=2039455 RepID=UPI003B2192C7
MRERIRAGDADAFGELFDAYARAVYNHAYRLTGDWATAEDVVSLTFLEAWRLRERVEAEGGSLRPWLLGIATNTARNTRRGLRRHAAAMDRLPRDRAAEPDFADDVAGRLDDLARVAAVREAVLGLRRQEREVFALCAWAELSYEDAADALGIPVGTVRSRLSRARTKLAAELGVEPPGGGGQLRGGRKPAARPTPEGQR